jgi:hypothetical protein
MALDRGGCEAMNPLVSVGNTNETKGLTFKASATTIIRHECLVSQTRTETSPETKYLNI